MFQLLIKMLRAFMCRQKVVTVFITILLFISLLAVFLITAIVSGNVAKQKEVYKYYREYSLTTSTEEFQKFAENSVVLEENLNNCITAIGEFCDVEYIGLISEENSSDIDLETYAIDYLFCKENVYLGRFFTEEEFDNQNKKMIASNFINTDIIVGDVIQIGTDDYEVVGIAFDNQHRIIYNHELLNILPLSKITIRLVDVPNAEESKLVGHIISDYFPGFTMTEPVRMTTVLGTGDSVLNFLFFALFVLTLINIIFIYEYVLDKRKKYIIIMRICGAAKVKCVFLLLTEMMVLSIIVYLFAAFCSSLFLPYLLEFTTSGNYVYTLNISDYICVFVIYILTVIALFFLFLWKNICSISMTQLKH